MRHDLDKTYLENDGTQIRWAFGTIAAFGILLIFLMWKDA